MGERTELPATADSLDDFFESGMGDIPEADFDEFIPTTSEKQRLAEKRRRAEQRIEQRRLREELGFYDLELDDY